MALAPPRDEHERAKNQKADMGLAWWPSCNLILRRHPFLFCRNRLSDPSLEVRKCKEAMPRDPDPLLAILSVTLALGPPKSKCAPTPHMRVLLPCRRWGGAVSLLQEPEGAPQEGFLPLWLQRLFCSLSRSSL